MHPHHLIRVLRTHLSTLRGSVRRGSDNPPDCHSLPRRALRYPQRGRLYSREKANFVTDVKTSPAFTTHDGNEGSFGEFG